MSKIKNAVKRQKTKLLGGAQKFELTNETKAFYGTKLRRIRATRTFSVPGFGQVKAGDIGGYVENENNLSHAGKAWIADHGKCYDDAVVQGDALVRDHGRVFYGAQLGGRAVVKGRGALGGQVKVGGEAVIMEPALEAA